MPMWMAVMSIEAVMTDAAADAATDDAADAVMDAVTDAAMDAVAASSIH